MSCLSHGYTCTYLAWGIPTYSLRPYIDIDIVSIDMVHGQLYEVDSIGKLKRYEAVHRVRRSHETKKRDENEMVNGGTVRTQIHAGVDIARYYYGGL